MTKQKLLEERKKELDKSKQDLKLVSIKYQEVKSKLVCNITVTTISLKSNITLAYKSGLQAFFIKGM